MDDDIEDAEAATAGAHIVDHKVTARAWSLPTSEKVWSAAPSIGAKAPTESEMEVDVAVEEEDEEEDEEA